MRVFGWSSELTTDLGAASRNGIAQAVFPRLRSVAGQSWSYVEPHQHRSKLVVEQAFANAVRSSVRDRPLLVGRISPPPVEPVHAEPRRRGGRRRRWPILASMKSRLVWTSDPEAAKRLREEGA